MGLLTVLNTQTNTSQQFSDGYGSPTFDQTVASIDAGIRAKTIVPIRPDGSYYRVQEILGGFLLDGMPLNVLLGGPWLQGQQDVLAPLIQAGKVPAPPADVWSRGNVPMPANVAAAVEAQLGGSSIPTWVWIAGAGLVAYLFMGRGSSSRRSADDDEL